MRSVLRLGLAAVSLAGSFAVAAPASAACAPVSANGDVNAEICAPGCTYVQTTAATVAVCDNPGSITTHGTGGDLVVCWKGHAPYAVWVAAPVAGIAPYDQVQVVVNRAGLAREICAGLFQ